MSETIDTTRPADPAPIGHNRPRAMTPAERQAKRRARLRAEGLPDTTKAAPEVRRAQRKAWRARRKVNALPFVGVDGEGLGTDADGRQHYMLFRMGERELYTGQPLSTLELLNFITDAPKHTCNVGFAFNYDVTMILRDLPADKIDFLFEKKPIRGNRYAWWRNFQIMFTPDQSFTVRRMMIASGELGAKPERCAASVTIFDAFHFFGASFLKTVADYGIASEDELARLAKGKAERGKIATIDAETRAYCAAECRLLAGLMERFREHVTDAGIPWPRTWNGPGKLAKALHKAHGTPDREQVAQWLPRRVIELSELAYYGGRMEVTRVGQIRSRVYEYDLNSAYPAAMVDLPCLVHGKWSTKTAAQLRTHAGPYVCAARFHPGKGANKHLGPLPIRAKAGHIFFPGAGGGVYWSYEIEAARRAGWVVATAPGWAYQAKCDCKPFSWIGDLYDRRAGLAQGPSEALKKALAALYGVLVQRQGYGPYRNPVWGSMITAKVRAQLVDAARQAPGSVVMLATDSLFTTRPIRLDRGDGLGQWRLKSKHESLFVVQPGLYWDPAGRLRRSRGLPRRNFFEDNALTPVFERRWHAYELADRRKAVARRPSVETRFDLFVGLRLARHGGGPREAKPPGGWKAGTWIERSPRQIAFDWSTKRDGHKWAPKGGAVITGRKPGGPKLMSVPYRELVKDVETLELWERQKIELGDLPEPVFTVAPWRED